MLKRDEHSYRYDERCKEARGTGEREPPSGPARRDGEPDSRHDRRNEERRLDAIGDVDGGGELGPELGQPRISLDRWFTDSTG
jgi:hypothetical protein